MTKKQFWSTVLLISIVSIIDFQFFTAECYHNISPIRKGVGHIITLSIIGGAGYRLLKGNDTQVCSLIWSYVYVAIGGLTILLGIAHYQFHFFSYAHLATFGMLRAFFTTPAPFFMSYMLQDFCKV